MGPRLAPLLLAAALALGGEGQRPTSEPAARAMQPQPRAEQSAAQAKAGGAFDHHCGSCHRSDRATANPKALAVFDLTREGWLTGMTVTQVGTAIKRMKGISGAGEEERRAALLLLDAELTRRNAR